MSRSASLSLVAGLPFVWVLSTQAATPQFWNAGGTGGDGIWGTGPADQNWNTAVGAAGPNYAWPVSGDHLATFQDAVGGTVAVFGEVTAAGIRQNGAAYIIEGGTIRLENGADAGSPGIAVESGALSVASSLTGNDGLVKSGAGTLTLSGLNTFTGATQLTGGSLVLAGPNQLSDLGALGLSAGTTLILSAGIETVGSVVANGGMISGSGTLTAGTYELNNGTIVSANLGNGAITSNSSVGISGNTGTGSLSVATGTLAFTGVSAAGSVQISNGATLLLGGSLADSAALVNAGTVTMNVSDTIASYVSNGGTLGGNGVLTAGTYVLNDGSTVTGKLGGGLLETSGAVQFSGSSSASLIQITSGTLTNTGTLGTVGAHLDIAGGARLIAGGTQNFSLLTTSAGGTGTWQGSLANAATVAPGGNAAIGALRVEGDFVNGPGGTLSLDVGTAGFDLVQVTGLASFGGVLDLHRFGPGEIEAMVSYQLIQAGSYSGNFASISENLAGVVIFNPANGSITRLDIDGGASFLSRVSANQASIWTALYDDVIDPGSTNVRYRPGQAPPYEITGGIASDESPSLLWALNASFTPDGLDRALLDRLSPEVYLSLPDYAIQATRHHRRTAWSAPTLAAGPVVASSGSKDAKSVVTATPARSWEFFAAADWFNGETSASLHQADYELSGAGVVAGARLAATERLRVAAYLAGDDGEIRGDLIDADGTGVSAGVLGEWMISPAHSLKATGGLSYGSYTFEGSRGSAIATGAGWSPGLAPFEDVDTEALDLHLGIEAVAFKTERFRLMPSFGLNFTMGSADDFREFGGQAISLAVDGTHRNSRVAEFALGAEYEVARQVSMDGEVGFNFDLRDDDERVSARFTDGSRPMAVTGSMLADDLIFLGLGATWAIRDDVSLRLGYRVECRSDADALNAINLSSSFHF